VEVDGMGDVSIRAAFRSENPGENGNLPAHYPTLDEALDRVAYLKGKGFKARALALLATPTDTAAEFESAKIQPPE
jgi:hypothetical protein